MSGYLNIDVKLALVFYKHVNLRTWQGFPFRGEGVAFYAYNNQKMLLTVKFKAQSKNKNKPKLTVTFTKGNPI